MLCANCRRGTQTTLKPNFSNLPRTTRILDFVYWSCDCMKYSLNDYASYMSERCVRIEGFSNTEMAAKLVAVYLLNGFRCVSCCQMFSSSSVSIKTTKFKQDFDRYCLRPTKKMQEVFLPLAARNQITGRLNAQLLSIKAAE